MLFHKLGKFHLFLLHLLQRGGEVDEEAFKLELLTEQQIEPILCRT